MNDEAPPPTCIMIRLLSEQSDCHTSEYTDVLHDNSPAGRTGLFWRLHGASGPTPVDERSGAFLHETGDDGRRSGNQCQSDGGLPRNANSVAPPVYSLLGAG